MEKIEAICPDCQEKNVILWFPAYERVYKVRGTAGISGNRFDGRREKVRGRCKCGYKFKASDLD